MVSNVIAYRIYLLLLPIFLLDSGVLSAQSYTFRQAKSNYVELESADYTILEGGQGFGNISLRPDFEFPAFGTTYDFNEGAKIVMLQGHMFHVNATRSFTFYFFEVDLKGRDGADEVSEWSYKLSGTKGNQTLKMQWKNMGLENGSSTDYVNYQIWMYERTGRMEVRIGPNSISEGAYGQQSGAAIGLLEMTPNFSSIYEQAYLVGPAASPEFKQVDYNFITGTPEEGTIYVFEDPNASDIESTSNSYPNIELYPSVASESITLTFPEVAHEQLTTIQIVNMHGQVVSSEKVSASQASSDVSGLAKGLYRVTIQRGHYWTTKSFIKE